MIDAVRDITHDELGDLVSPLERATGQAVDVDVVIVHEAPIPLEFRSYFDFKPIHERCVAGALKAAARG